MKRSLGGYLRTLVVKYKSLAPKSRIRLKAAVAVVLFAGLGVYITTQIFGAASDVTGTVFRDFNGNGIRDNAQGTNPSQAADRGVAGVTVRGFGEDGTLCDTRVSDANGGYTLQMSNCSGAKFRVEFSGLPDGFNPTQVGADSKTTTQFVPAGGTANLGVYRPSDFCQNNPMLVTSCIRNGAYNGDEKDVGTVLGFLYSSSGTTAPTLKLGQHGQVGATYGQVYRPYTKTVYSSAFMKRHADFGPGGVGAIYAARVPASGTGTVTPNLAVTIPNSGGNSHPKSDGDCDSKDGQNGSGDECWSHDQFSFDAATKRSLGSMVLVPNYTNPANDALLVVNLNDRQLYKVTNLDGTPSTASYPMPLSLPNSGNAALASGVAAGQHQGCTADDVRPFAITVHDGKGYAGFVCSAQTTRSTSNLRAYVYGFDPVSMAFASSPALEFPLNYERSCAYGSGATCAARATWMPWISQITDPLANLNVNTTSNGARSSVAPQPILSDLAFSDNGSLTIGFRDRFDDQMSYQAKSTNPNSDQRYIPETAGDTLRACLVNGIYILESAGKCDGKGRGSDDVHAVASGLPQGIGGYEFYSNEFFANTNGSVLNRDETSGGALAQVPGYDSFASTATNPLDGSSLGLNSGGIRNYTSENGGRTGAYRLYQNNPGDSYLKANALGDINVICDSAPIEIGNRVWKDSNGNGVQDAAEPGIAGVTVTLTSSAGAIVASAITDSEGTYVFSSRTLDANGQTMPSTASQRYGLTNLTTNTSGYKLTLNSASDYANAARLQDLGLTTSDATANYGNDQNDSDAIKPLANSDLSATNPATITVATAGPGANNHNYDFGFAELSSIGNFVWQDSNKDGRVNGGEANQGINGVKVSLYAVTADTDNDGRLSSAELAAATPLATKVTANDIRNGATNGRAGYYQFSNLAKGNYFVAIGASNFAAGQPLQPLTNVPVPSGVGDTQDDNTNHGDIPAGGNLAANGVVSTKITIEPGTEPTSSSTKPDDDASDSSDMTIDFGFWHAYSLGNRVWIDKNNSATIDEADGAAPGIAGVQVNLLASNGSFLQKTDTGAGGYYRFDNLSAGTYIVEIPSQNFAQGKVLYNYPVSSIGGGQEIDPDANGDSNDNGINPDDIRQAVRSGTVTLGPGATEPTGETDLASSGQGTEDNFANMTVDFGFVGTTSFGDTVFYDLNGDGDQDDNDPGILNVTVTLVCAGPDGNFNTTADNTTATQKTDNNGNYLFVGLLPGTCKGTVTTSDVPGATLTTPGSFTSPVDQDSSFLDADFGFEAKGVIGNQVWKEVFSNGTYNTSEGDTGIAGVKIDLYRDANGNNVVDDTDLFLGSKTTDSNGRYQFGGLPTDDLIASNGAGAQYVVKVNGPADKFQDLQLSTGPNPGADNNSQTPAGYPMTLTLAAPNNQTGDFGYHGLATVGDTVFYDTNNNGVQDPDETPLPGITVTITYPGPDNDCLTASDNATKSMVTNANGNYLFTELLGGEYCISIVPPAGTTITTNNQGEQFTLGPTQVDLTRDFGVIGNGVIGNQLFVDYNTNGRYDSGDTGIADVTLDLYRDLNNNGVIDAGDTVIKTAKTNDDGRYKFEQLMTGTDAVGIGYIVVVSDTQSKVVNLTHVPGNGTTADNESKNPAGFGIVLTPSSNNHPEADFGYKVNPTVIEPPKFWKDQSVDGDVLTYTLTWINRSALQDVPTNFTDAIPTGTQYVPDSLLCTPQGSSVTQACVYNAAQNRIEWRGTVGPDVGHNLPEEAVNKVTVIFKVKLDSLTLDVSNQGFGNYDQDGDGNTPSDNIRTPELDDPNLYSRTPTDAAIVTATGGVLANTGQLILAVVALAGVVMLSSVGLVFWSRRHPRW